MSPKAKPAKKHHIIKKKAKSTKVEPTRSAMWTQIHKLATKTIKSFRVYGKKAAKAAYVYATNAKIKIKVRSGFPGEFIVRRA